MRIGREGCAGGRSGVGSGRWETKDFAREGGVELDRQVDTLDEDVDDVEEAVIEDDDYEDPSEPELVISDKEFLAA